MLSALWRVPNRSELRIHAALYALLFVALYLPPSVRPGGTGPMGKLKLTLSLIAVFGPPAVVGYRRHTPLVAFALSYLFVMTGRIITGMWRAVAMGASSQRSLLDRFVDDLLYDVPELAVPIAIAGYVGGLAAGTVARAEWWPSLSADRIRP